MIVTNSARKKAINLAHKYNVKVRFVDHLTCLGKADYQQSIAYISIFITDLSRLYSVVLHETGHIVAFRNQKYSAYHHPEPINKLSRRQKIDAARTALNAEVYVDKWAENEFNKLFPDRKYKRTYRTKADKIWLRKYINKLYF